MSGSCEKHGRNSHRHRSRTSRASLKNSDSGERWYLPTSGPNKNSPFSIDFPKKSEIFESFRYLEHCFSSPPVVCNRAPGLSEQGAQSLAIDETVRPPIERSGYGSSGALDCFFFAGSLRVVGMLSRTLAPG